MARPLRIEFPDAVYHVTSRGDRQERIFCDDGDRELFLRIVDLAMARLDAEVFAFCLMGNHFHLVVRTRQPNLSRLMRHINGGYTQGYNRRHAVKGHLFQRRFHAVLVDSDAYLVEVCRYVELNPVRAGLVGDPAQWTWSSYRAHVGLQAGYPWLATNELLGHLSGADITTGEHRRRATELYAETVLAGLGVDLWKTHLRGEIFLGQDEFVAKMQALATRPRMACAEIAGSHRADPRALERWMKSDRSRQESFRLAYTEGGMSMGQIALQAGMSISSVSRLIRLAEADRIQDLTPVRFKT
jgi:REP element-mobilizing transposase RayT